MIDLLKEIKEVLTQLDWRLNGKCYNRTEENCQCTMCKINAKIKQLEKPQESQQKLF